LITYFLVLKEKVLSNKTSWGVGITQVVEGAMVPWEYGMVVTGHWDPIFYKKWHLLLLNLSLPLFLSIFAQCWFFSLSTIFYDFVFVSTSLLAFGFYCKYNQIDKHLWDKTLPHVISGELKANCLLHYDETFIEEKETFEKTTIKFIFHFWIFILNFFFHHFTDCYFFILKFFSCVGSVVDSFLPMHAPKIICNFHDGVHVHSKFFGENAPSF
jgi:hypothetical protein